MKSKPLTSFEESLLLELINNKRNIVESKVTNRFFNSKKVKAWQEITAAFNGNADVSPRTFEQINNWWKNMKKKTKFQIAQTRRAVMKTGGGPEEDKDTDRNTDFVASIVQDQMYPLVNPNDCDAGFLDGKDDGLVSITEVHEGESQDNGQNNGLIVLVNHGDTANNESQNPPPGTSSSICRYTATKPIGSTCNLTMPCRKPPKFTVKTSKITEAQKNILQNANDEHSLKRKVLEEQLENEALRKIIHQKKIEKLDFELHLLKQQQLKME